MPWSLLLFGPVGLSAGIDHPVGGVIGSACARCGSQDHAVSQCTWPNVEGNVTVDAGALLNQTSPGNCRPAMTVPARVNAG